jgi:hypothetical protein
MPTLRSTAFLVAGFGLAVACFGLVPTWGTAAVASVVVGGFYFSAMTTLNTLVQFLADENMRGRISSLFVIGWAGLVPIGGLWQGIFASTFGARRTLVVAGLVTAAYALIVALFVRSESPSMPMHLSVEGSAS